jgi:hypothetical protein
VIEFWPFIPELNWCYFPYNFYLNDFCSNKCFCMLIKGALVTKYDDTTYMKGEWLPVGQFDFSLSQNIPNAQNFKPRYLTTKWVANILFSGIKATVASASLICLTIMLTAIFYKIFCSFPTHVVQDTNTFITTNDLVRGKWLPGKITVSLALPKPVIVHKFLSQLHSPTFIKPISLGYAAKPDYNIVTRNEHFASS